MEKVPRPVGARRLPLALHYDVRALHQGVDGVLPAIHAGARKANQWDPRLGCCVSHPLRWRALRQNGVIFLLAASMASVGGLDQQHAPARRQCVIASLDQPKVVHALRNTHQSHWNQHTLAHNLDSRLHGP